MSIWVDIHKQSSGEEVRKEDSIYNYGAGYYIISKDKYKNTEYHIVANDGIPYIKIYMPLRISAFAGCDEIEVKTRDGKEFRLSKLATKEHNIITYKFDKEGDYVDDKHPGHENSHSGKQYAFSELKNYAQEFIDQLLDMEDRFIKDM